MRDLRAQAFMKILLYYLLISFIKNTLFYSACDLGVKAFYFTTQVTLLYDITAYITFIISYNAVYFINEYYDSEFDQNYGGYNIYRLIKNRKLFWIQFGREDGPGT